MRILVVDDHYAIARLLQRYFGREGHDGTLFTDSETCLSEFRKGVYAVAFLDVYLSSSPNGIELAEKLRAIDPEINIIIMSAHWSTADRVRDAGFGELLRKPFTLEEASARLGE